MFHPAPISSIEGIGVVSCLEEGEVNIDLELVVDKETDVMSRVSELENSIEASKNHIKTLLEDIEVLKGKIADDEAELERLGKKEQQFRDDLVAVLKKHADVENAHDVALEVVSDFFDLDEEGGVIVEEPVEDVVEEDDTLQQEQELPVSNCREKQHSRDVDEFEMTFGIKYPTSEITADKARNVVSVVAQAHKDNPGGTAPKLELLLSKYSNLFDIEGLTVVKDAKLALDEFLSQEVSKLEVKSDIISPDDDLSHIPF